MSEETLFHQVVEKPAEERPAFLNSACGGDTALRQRIERLLRAYESPGSFLQLPAPDVSGTTDDAVIEAPGTVIGSYKLLERIGEGGFGLVFMAEQMQPVRRKVALKILKPGMDTRQVVARFEVERQALAIMDHPNIAHVLDGGETASGRPFFVMELVRGIPIIDFCDQNQLSIRERLDLFVSVCHAVQHAHQKGIIHRDLKPSNLMVTMHDNRPVVKVIDFGIAKATGQQLTEKTLFTNFAQMVGTPMYMSPEQAQMSGLDIDTRSDIYSLGVLLYELLTGTTPFDKERLRTAAYDELRRIIREEEPPMPSTRLSTLGMAAVSTVSSNRQSDPVRLRQLFRGDLDWIVMKCLEKDRNRRYETANGLAMDIHRYLNDEPVVACPPSAIYRLRKHARRNKVALVTTGLVAGVLLLGSIVSIWQAIRANQAESLAVSRLKEADSARQVAVSERDRAEHRLFEARLAQARASRWSRQVGQRFESWKAVAEAATLARELKLQSERLMELRDEAVACLALADVRTVGKEWEGLPPGSSGHVTFDADLEHYARSDLKGNISIRGVSDDRELAVLPSGGASGAGAMTFSPDGRWIAVRHWHPLPGQSTNFRMWDWRSRACVFQPTFSVDGTLAFSPDSRHLALGHDSDHLTIHEVPTGREEKQIRLGLKPYALAFHPNGSRLAVASYAGQEIQIRDMASGDLLQKWSAPAGVFHIAWHPDGVLLAAGCRDHCAYLWDPATGLQHGVMHGHQNSVVSLAFAPTGNTVVSEAWDGTSRFWDLATGRELLRLAGSLSHFSRDGQRLISRTGSKLTVLDVGLGWECRTLPRSRHAPGEVVCHGGFSPDGRWLAVGTSAGVRLWDMVLGTENAFLPVSSTLDVKFHPSGGDLFTAGQAGLYRWPWHTHADSGSLEIGPARKLDVTGPLEDISLDRVGRIVTVVARGASGGGRVLSLEKTEANKALELNHQNAVCAATSPNGEWVATGTHEGFGVKVWDARSGELLRDLNTDKLTPTTTTTVTVSPDGRWLVTGTSAAFDIWKAGSWELAHHIRREPGGVTVGSAAFSPDSKILAIAFSGSVVRLIDVATNRPLARLQPPDADTIAWLAFSPDGSQLAVATGADVIRLWDLRSIRERLKEIGLDWDLPPYPPSPSPGVVQPMRVEVELGEFLHFTQAEKHFASAHKYSLANQWRDAIAEYSQGLELQPDHPPTLNNLAWCLVNCPDPQFRDVARAIPLAQKAVEQSPETAVYWNTLGVAQYCAGEWTTAIAALEKSEQLEPGRHFSFNAFFLAMAHWQLGNDRGDQLTEIEEQARVVKQHYHQERARKWFDQAVEWMEKNEPNDAELRQFRAQAEELMHKKAETADQE
jgi:serine/threonine protein kinase/WD40 repeat protein